MTAVYIISILVLALTSFAIYRTKLSASTDDETERLPPTGLRGLFGASGADESADAGGGEDSAAAAAASLEARERQAASLRARSALGDRTVLTEAQRAGEPELYTELLDALVAHAAGSTEELRALVSYVTRSDGLRANTRLAEAFLQHWMKSGEHASGAATATDTAASLTAPLASHALAASSSAAASTAEMLHVAALSDDASLYGRAIEAALARWRAGEIGGLSAQALCGLCETQYWLLAPEARSSGAGFVLKQTLADVRRQLTTEARRA